MTRIYGHRWSSAYGEADDGTWRACLRGLVGEQLARGLRECVDSGDPWPPTAPAFRRMCLGLGVDTSDGAAVAARMPAHRALPEPDDVRAERRARARVHIAECWKALGREPKGATE